MHVVFLPLLDSLHPPLCGLAAGGSWPVKAARLLEQILVRSDLRMVILLLLTGLPCAGVCFLPFHLLLECHQGATAMSGSGKYLLVEILCSNPFRLVYDGALWQLWLSEVDVRLGNQLMPWLLRVRGFVFHGMFLLLWELPKLHLPS